MQRTLTPRSVGPEAAYAADVASTRKNAKKTPSADEPGDVYPGIDAARVQHLNEIEDPGAGRYVLYWMQQAQRTEFNHALEFAIHHANDLGKQLLVAFGLMDDYPEANLRHYHFMLQGLADVDTELTKRDITFVVRRGAPNQVAIELAADAAVVVCDRGCLRIQRQWRDHVATQAGCPVIQVESDVVVPVELVSDKAEYAARTIRPKITKHLDRFLVPLPASRLKLDTEVPPVAMFTGGMTAGKEVLKAFLEEKFSTYTKNRNQPQTDDVSHMSKYLHFGQLSAVYIAMEARKSQSTENVDSFIEELIIRRELPMNFVYFEPDYDSYTSIPGWARKSLSEHKTDERENSYTRAELEAAETHDAYWNAAMREMKVTGYMHNYMRMYWGKKIIEWSNTPEYAYQTSIYLNDKYFLDGRDANSYANIGWLFGTHDRGWTERPVLGKVRWMSAGGLERKSDPKAYVAKVDKLVDQVETD